MDLLDSRTLAVINPDFLGIKAKKDVVLEICRESGARLISDACQSRPSLPMKSIESDEYLVYSFGRGKPITAMAGGALVGVDSKPEFRRSKSRRQSALTTKLKRRVFPLATSSAIYSLVTQLPGSHVGKTVVKQLRHIDGLDIDSQYAICRSILNDPGDQSSIICKYDSWVSAVPNLDPLHRRANSHLLRFGILVSETLTGNKIRKALVRAGIGATTMYGKALTELPEFLEYADASPETPNAASFARRLVTLPVHNQLPKDFFSRLWRASESVTT